MLTSWTKASYLLTDCDCSICCHSWNVLFHLSLEILQYHRLFHKRQVTARCSITCRSNCTVVQCSIFVDQKEDKFYDISDVLYCVSVSNVAKMCSTQGPSVRRATPETIFILMLRTDRYYWFTLLQYGPSASHLHHLRILWISRHRDKRRLGKFKFEKPFFCSSSPRFEPPRAAPSLVTPLEQQDHDGQLTHVT